ncbi:MAG: hypothetical protein H0W72_12895 [Planctomycetes bacterium]|nr:hypothetical protein [Planctomycetota bacterium]
MSTSTPEPQAGEGGSAGDEPTDPLAQLFAHAKEILAATRTRFSLAIDASIGSLQRLLAALFLLAFLACLAFVIACFGAYHLVSGSVAALEGLIGNRWAPSLIVGALSLGCAAALILVPYQYLQRSRLKRLRAKYDQRPPAGP